MTTVSRTVHELVFSHDEGYYTVAVFADPEEAARVAGAGNALLDTDRPMFEVRPQDVIVGTGDWTRDDFIDALDPWDVSDWFLGEMEEE